MRRRLGAVLAFGAVGIVASGISSSAAHAQAGYTYTTLDVPGSVQTFGLGINGGGEVTGYYYDGRGVTTTFGMSCPGIKKS